MAMCMLSTCFIIDPCPHSTCRHLIESAVSVSSCESQVDSWVNTPACAECSLVGECLGLHSVSVLCSHSPGSCSDCNKEDSDLGDRRDPEVSALVPFE